MGLKQNGEKKNVQIQLHMAVSDAKLSKKERLRNINYSRNSLNYLNCCESQHVLEKNLSITQFILGDVTHLHYKLEPFCTSTCSQVTTNQKLRKTKR